MTTHKRRTSKLELEPNPFEQSFSRVRSSENIAESLLERSTESPSLSASLRSGDNNGASPAKRESGPWRRREEDDDESAGRTAIITANTASSYEPPLSASSASSSASKQGQQQQQQKAITLPPVTAINTPLHASRIGEAWGPESLRSGPLSPAMLGGPASNSSAYKPLAARTTPRLGMSDPALHTGLTPFISGEAHPSSGIGIGITAAPFENNNSASLITTPGLQAVIRATIEGKDIMATPGGSLHIAPTQKSHYPTADNNSVSVSSRPQQVVGAAVYGPVVSGAHSTAVSAGMTSMLDASQAATDAAIAAAVSSAYSAAPIAAIQQQNYYGPNKQGVSWPMAAAGSGVFGEEGVERNGASAQNYELKRSAAHMLSGEEERSDTSVLQMSAGVAHQSQSQSLSQSLPPSHAKRARSINSNSNSNRNKGRNSLGGANAAAAEDLDVFSGSGENATAAASAAKRRGRVAKKEETHGNNNNSNSSALKLPSPSPSPSQVAPDAEDEEKRRQFLERNRIAALKCRQRKKKQIQELQGRHDYVVSENKRLYADYMKLREEALHMRALLVAHRECSVAKASGVFGTDNLPLGMASLSLQQPMLLGSGFEAEQAQDIIAAIPPASNGVPVHSIDPATGHPINVNFLPQ
ncbi:Transcription factor [Coemansia sp. RSA 2049]|nr:Transcription factor [Coemansia sp. RSA 2049]